MKKILVILILMLVFTGTASAQDTAPVVVEYDNTFSTLLGLVSVVAVILASGGGIVAVLRTVARSDEARAKSEILIHNSVPADKIDVILAPVNKLAEALRDTILPAAIDVADFVEDITDGERG